MGGKGERVKPACGMVLLGKRVNSPIELKGDGGMTTSPTSSARDSKYPSFCHFGSL